MRTVEQYSARNYYPEEADGAAIIKVVYKWNLISLIVVFTTLFNYTVIDNLKTIIFQDVTANLNLVYIVNNLMSRP